MDIRSDRQKGINYKEIGKKYNINQRTAKRYAEAETKPVYQLSGPKRSKLDAYKRQIQWHAQPSLHPFAQGGLQFLPAAVRREGVGLRGLHVVVSSRHRDGGSSHRRAHVFSVHL